MENGLVLNFGNHVLLTKNRPRCDLISTKVIFSK